MRSTLHALGWLAVLAPLLAAPARASTYSSAVLADHPLHYWRLGESSGAAVDAVSAGGVNGTYNNAPTLGVAGAIAGDPDTAVQFGSATGAAGKAVTFASALGISGNFTGTWELWFNAPSYSVAGLAYTGLNANLSAFELVEGQALTGSLSVAFDGGYAWESNGSIFSLNQWHYLVGTKTPGAIGAGTTAIYLDGVLLAGHVTGGGGTPNVTDSSHYIGRHGDPTDSYPFPGSLDEVALYNVALTQAQVTAHFLAGTQPVPEPATLGLLLLGAAVGARRVRRGAASPAG